MINERKLSENELEQRTKSLKGLLKSKRSLVKKYGADAEKVMYGIATKQAKSKVENMNKEKLKELIQDALKNPKKADLNKDGKLSDYEEKRGAAIEKNMDEATVTESKGAKNYFDDLKFNYQKAFRYLDADEKEEYKQLAKNYFSKLQEALNEETFEDEIERLKTTMYVDDDNPRQILIHPLSKPDARRPDRSYIVVKGNNVVAVQGYDSGPIEDLAQAYGLDASRSSLTPMGQRSATGQASMLSSNILKDAIKAIKDSRDLEAKRQRDYYQARGPVSGVGNMDEAKIELDADTKFELPLKHLIQKHVNEALNPEVSNAVNRFIKAMAKRYGYSEQDAVYAIMAALKQRKFDGLNERVAKIDEILDEIDNSESLSGTIDERIKSIVREKLSK